ncbi:MAG: zinc-binding dehydrogenase, partial [Thermoplasmata archaeon]|nr:zinc-binding dehydrogenase [Thermoplasmata archaeon]
MRVAMYYNNSDIRVEEMPKPEIGPGELLVKVMASGICGSDVMEWYRVKRAPLVLGHEIAGEVVEAGEGAPFKAGDMVVASHHVPCNECHHCLGGDHTICDLMSSTNFDPGGFAEYLRIPSINVEKGGVYPLPGELSFEEGTFVEPLACILRGQRRARMRKGKNVLVLGSGISGILHVQLARALGANHIMATDIAEYRLESAKKFGADAAVNASEDLPEKLQELTNGLLADMVIVSTGAKPAVDQAVRCVERGGTILFFAPIAPDVGAPVPLNDIFWKRDVTLTTSYAGSPSDHLEAIEILRSRKVNVADMI